MRVYTLTFQRGSKDREITNWQLYQTASLAFHENSALNWPPSGLKESFIALPAQYKHDILNK